MLPREKYFEKGLDGLSDTDLISILVGSGIKGHSFLSVARKLVLRIRKTLETKGEVVIEDLLDIEGVGNITAMRITCGIELGRRLYDLHPLDKILVKNSHDAFLLLKEYEKKKQEYIIGLFLNSRFELLKKKVLGLGTVNGAEIMARDIIIPALEVNAVSVIIAHNHPSGDATPSDADISITKNLAYVLDLVGIKLLDHIVIGIDSWKSVPL